MLSRSLWDQRPAISKGLHDIGLGEKRQRLAAKRTSVALRETLEDWANDLLRASIWRNEPMPSVGHTSILRTLRITQRWIPRS